MGEERRWRDLRSETGSTQLVAMASPADSSPLVEPRTAVDLSPREAEVLSRVKRFCARRPGGWVEAEMIGSARTVERLRIAGLVRVELASMGPQGGKYFRIQAVEP